MAPSNVLLIKHLPEVLSLDEKVELLKHFGALQVWSPFSNNAVFASFETPDQAYSSLLRLHQLEIGNRRLVVEYAINNVTQPTGENITSNSIKANNNIKQFLKKLNAWNESVCIYQYPSPLHLYKYPEPTEEICLNIMKAMLKHKPLYTQVIHLMNKMCLPSPFNIDQDSQSDILKNFFSREGEGKETTDSIIDSESEVSSEEALTKEHVAPIKLKKRKSILPQTRKRAAAVLSSACMPKGIKVIKSDDAFEKSTLNVVKKINLNIPNVLECDNNDKKEDLVKEENIKTQDETAKQDVLTKKVLLENKISFEDMKKLLVFKNYYPGEPSNRLYIKNLAKTVTTNDLSNIYHRYVANVQCINDTDSNIRLMQEGRMKGQAFVELPSAEIAQSALNETNGYILKDKPMVVQFAKKLKTK